MHAPLARWGLARALLPYPGPACAHAGECHPFCYIFPQRNKAWKPGFKFVHMGRITLSWPDKMGKTSGTETNKSGPQTLLGLLLCFWDTAKNLSQSLRYSELQLCLANKALFFFCNYYTEGCANDIAHEVGVRGTANSLEVLHTEDHCI